MFLSLIFSFQNHREYYKNCTTRQPDGLYAPLSVPERRSTPIFMPYLRRRRHLVRFPAWTFWQSTARHTIGIPHRSTICSNTPHNSRCTPCHPALNAGSSKVSLAGTSLCRYFWIPRHSTVCSNTPHNSRCTPCHPALDAGSSPGQQTGSYPKMTLNNHNINIMLNAAMAKRPKQPAAIQPPAIPPPTASSPFPLWAYP